MSRAARFFWICALTAVLFFVALAAISKTALEAEGMLIFDSRVLGYEHAAAREYLTWIAQTPDGVSTYLGTFRQLDTVFPMLLAIALSGGIWLNTFGSNPLRRGLLLGAPSAYLLLDLMENARVAEMLRTGVTVADQVIQQASAFTVMKWALLVVSLLVLMNAWWRVKKKGAI